MNAPANLTRYSFLRGLHLCTLCAFAFTQPLLTALEKQPVYLHDQQFNEIEIGVLLGTLLGLIPFGFMLLDWIAQKISTKCGGYCGNVIPIALTCLILLSIIRPYSGGWWFHTYGLSGLLILAVVLPSSWWLVHRYEKSPAMQFWLSLTSIGLVVFPGMFLWEWHRNHLAANRINPESVIANPIPVVLVVFDEFSGTTIMNGDMEIDEERFPHFSRLAETSTWYRKATTVSPRTDIAVPAILSGNYPVSSRSPLATNYPQNLFELIDGSKAYDMKVFEPISRLCPETITEEPKLEPDHWMQSLDLLHTLAAVYPRLIFTNDTPVWFPPIPRAWFGARLGTYNKKWTESTLPGLFKYPGSDLRHWQQSHFLRCLKNTAKPEFCFFHTVYPHFPWSFLPSGTQYQSDPASPRIPVGARGELGEDWDRDPITILRNEFRYRLQVGDADRFIGLLLNRLETIGMIDRCLLIVTADHGVSFRPGHSRRIPDGETLPDIFSVPLFIKYPGQTESRRDDRNVELIDIFPTIADCLQMRIPQPIDGQPISADPRRARKTLYFESSMTVVEPGFPQLASSLQRQKDVFGTTKLDELPAAGFTHPEWHGRSISEFVINERTVKAMQRSIYKTRDSGSMNYEADIEPRLISGYFLAENLPASPVQIVLAVDGIIVDTGKSFLTEMSQVGFEFLIPESAAPSPFGVAELYVVDPSGQMPQLRPVKIIDTYW